MEFCEPFLTPHTMLLFEDNLNNVCIVNGSGFYKSFIKLTGLFEQMKIGEDQVLTRSISIIREEEVF